MKKQSVLVLVVLLFVLLHLYTEWKFENDPPKGVVEQVEEWVGELGETPLTKDAKLAGQRQTGSDDDTGTYRAECEDKTGQEVLFGGGAIKNRKLKICGTLGTVSGSAMVHIQTSRDTIELTTNKDGVFETSVSLKSGGSYVVVAYRNIFKISGLTMLLHSARISSPQ